MTGCQRDKKGSGTEQAEGDGNFTGVVATQQITPNDGAQSYVRPVIDTVVPEADAPIAETTSRRIWFKQGITVAIFDQGVPKLEGLQGWVISPQPAWVRSESNRLSSEIVDKVIPMD